MSTPRSQKRYRDGTPTGSPTTSRDTTSREDGELREDPSPEGRFPEGGPRQIYVISDSDESWNPDIKSYAQDLVNMVTNHAGGSTTSEGSRERSRSTSDAERNKFNNVDAQELDEEASNRLLFKKLFKKNDNSVSSVGRYWGEPKERSAPKCYQCGKRGHMARDCPRSAENLCYICGHTDHTSRDCPNERCSKCLELGHEEAKCQNERVDLTFCFRCGSRDHYAAECDGKKLPSNPNLRCMHCYKEGHVNCCGPTKAKNITWCSQCGSDKHVKLNCRNQPMNVQDIALGYHSGRKHGGHHFYPYKSCYHCASLKHLAKDCPARPNYGYHGRSSNHWSGYSRHQPYSRKSVFLQRRCDW